MSGPSLSDPVHPATQGILDQLLYRNLPVQLQEAVAPIQVAAGYYVRTIPAGPELTVILRKLLEAADGVVRNFPVQKGST